MHPYSTNTDRLKFFVFLGLVSALFTPLANELLRNFQFLKELEPWVSAGVSFGAIYGLAYAAFNSFIWRLKMLKMLHAPTVPDLRGTYKGKLISSYKQTEVELQIEIEQTWTKILVYLQTGTDSSESYSYMASMFELDGKSVRLSYTYTNEPFSAIADPDMQPHDGTASLVFRKDGSVKGKYFNARQRTGTIVLKKI